ncbi:MAG: DUF4372 domain-containing protein, partial [Gemmatimonas sp.]
MFAQLMELLPVRTLHRCAARYGGNRKVRTLRCLDQFLALAFAQLTYRESLRDVCVCLEALGGKRYHMGLRAPVKRSTLADANERRDWRIFRDFAEFVIAQTRPLYANEPLDLALQESVYALDAPLIRLCRSVLPWATYRQTTVGIKLHTVLDLRGALPTIVRLSPGRVNDMTTSSTSTRVSVTSPPRTKRPLPSSTLPTPGASCRARTTSPAAPGVCTTSSGVSASVRVALARRNSPGGSTVNSASRTTPRGSTSVIALSRGRRSSTATGGSPTKRATSVAGPVHVVRRRKAPVLSLVAR